MNSSSQRGPDPARILAILGGVAVMVLLLSVLIPAIPGRTEADRPLMASATEPIPEEAQVFRTRPEDVAAGLAAAPRREAQPRTLAIYRRLRAYPGAPPRVPHGLTDQEFRTPTCNTCHERGGYAARFGGYAPVTPHPEYAQCLQCHAVDAMSVGIPVPDRPTDLVCTQCHVDPGQPPPSLVSIDWRPLPHPELGQRGLREGPLVIPHGLHLRGNCVACHAGPGAVREIRTTHPERANCRQCHVPALMDGEFSRLAGGGGP